MPYYLNKINNGLRYADSAGDGANIVLKWFRAFPTAPENKLGYNIYMSVVPEGLFSTTPPPFQEDFFYHSPQFIVLDGYLQCTIGDLEPGQMYRFGIRAIEYDTTFFDPHSLPLISDGLHIYPTSLLASDISATDTVIPLIDAELFPLSGVVRIGDELVYYDAIDYDTNELLVPGGTNPINAQLVDLDGYGDFYLPSVSNTGTGTINDLTLINTNSLTQTVTIKCVSAQRNNLNQIIPGTADFTVIGSISGAAGDGYGDVQYWQVNQGVVTSNLLSFGITEETTFAIGDSFTVKIHGMLPGAGGGRGYLYGGATEHTVDGYDGYHFSDPNVIMWLVGQIETNDKVFECWNRFDIRHEPYTIVDGYHQKVLDILTTDLSVSDAQNADFPMYPFNLYNRADPVQIIAGTCVGSYIGGTVGCADGYYGAGMMIRGTSMQDQSEQRLEVQLTVTGEKCCLVKREWTGITCHCYLPYNEYPQAKCTSCFGTGFVVGYNQYFDNRYSDGKIYVRFSPVVDDLIPTDAGLESTMQPDCWTLPVPTVKDRDFIVRFDVAGNEEFRYEILNVTRNRLFLAMEGMQRFSVQRIRKTDPIYQVPIFYDTSMFPSMIQTSITGNPPAFPPHSHNITISEKILSVSQINQLTDTSYSHNHVITNGVQVPDETGHIHTIIIPQISYPPELITPPSTIPQSSS